MSDQGNRVKTIPVPVNEAEKERFVDAARRQGLQTATWLRALGIRASEELEKERESEPRTA